MGLDTLAEAIDDSETDWDVSTEAIWRENDRILVDFEIVKVTARGATLTVERAQANTVAATHANGATLYRITRKWEVTGLQFLPDLAQFKVEMQEMPHDYTPVGIVVENTHPDSDTATAEELLNSGWVVYNSTRLFEEDEDSAYSHVGAN